MLWVSKTHKRKWMRYETDQTQMPVGISKEQHDDEGMYK